jgi:hypothetical protein
MLQPHLRNAGSLKTHKDRAHRVGAAGHTRFLESTPRKGVEDVCRPHTSPPVLPVICTLCDTLYNKNSQGIS